MSEQFDPYHRWLGIPPKEQPPNHYRLLGIELFESDRNVIDSVATRHMSYLQEITNGPYVKEAQGLLNELSAARRCLLDSEKKAAYDTGLKAKLAPERKPPKAASPAKPPKAAKPSAPLSPPKRPQEPPLTVTDTAPRLPGKKAKREVSGKLGSGKRERQNPTIDRKKSRQCI